MTGPRRPASAAASGGGSRAGAGGPAGYRAAAAALYAGAPMPVRLRQWARPVVCPFEWVTEHVPPGARVLDLGCGAGLLLALLARHGRVSSGTGLDPSAAAIDAARLVAGRLAGTGAALAFHQQDARSFRPAADHDVVCLVDVLHHVPPAAQADVFARACAAVRPGGLLVYKDMGRRPRWRAAANQVHDLLLAGEWVHLVPVETVERWAAEQSMPVTAAIDGPRLWYQHELRVFRRPAAAGSAPPPP